MKTTELIKELNTYYDIYAEFSHDRVLIYNKTLPSVPFIYGVHKEATVVYEYLNRIAPSMQGLCLDTLADIKDLIDKYLATPIEDREDTSLYYLKTASPLVSEQTQYLNYNRLSEKYFYSSVYNDEDHIKYIFTQTEVDNMDTTGLIPEPITDSEEKNK